MAAVVCHNHAGKTTAYSGASTGGTKSYIPSLFKSYYGWWSAYENQEVGGSRADSVWVYYYPTAYMWLDLDAQGHKEVWMGLQLQIPNDWHGSARVSVTVGDGQVATAVHHANDTGAVGYHGSTAGARDPIVPFLNRNLSGWDAALIVQNVGTTDTQVTVRFYNSYGSEIGFHGPFTLGAGHSQELYSELPSGVDASAWVHSDAADVVVAVHHTEANGRAMGYSVP